MASDLLQLSALIVRYLSVWSYIDLQCLVPEFSCFGSSVASTVVFGRERVVVLSFGPETIWATANQALGTPQYPFEVDQSQAASPILHRTRQWYRSSAFR